MKLLFPEKNSKCYRCCAILKFNITVFSRLPRTLNQCFSKPSRRMGVTKIEELGESDLSIGLDGRILLLFRMDSRSCDFVFGGGEEMQL